MDLEELIKKWKEDRQNDPLFQISKLKAQQVRDNDLKELPGEQKFHEDLTSAVAGSISPVAQTESIVPKLASKVDQAKSLANAFGDAAAEGVGNLINVARSQNELSRAVDFAQRNEAQARALRALRRGK